MAKIGLGFRVKSGWASAVMLAGASSTPTVLHARHIDLCDPTVPESRQPFHAVEEGQGELERDEDRIEKRLQVVRHVTRQSLGRLLEDCRASGWIPERAGIVTGSLVEPSTINAPHIRAHAMEGRLFRTVVEETLRGHELACVVLGEKTALAAASQAIHREEGALKQTLASLGRHVAGPWRSEEKLAALAAWVALSGERRARSE